SCKFSRNYVTDSELQGRNRTFIAITSNVLILDVEVNDNTIIDPRTGNLSTRIRDRHLRRLEDRIGIPYIHVLTEDLLPLTSILGVVLYNLPQRRGHLLRRDSIDDLDVSDHTSVLTDYRSG